MKEQSSRQFHRLVQIGFLKVSESFDFPFSNCCHRNATVDSSEVFGTLREQILDIFERADKNFLAPTPS